MKGPSQRFERLRLEGWNAKVGQGATRRGTQHTASLLPAAASLLPAAASPTAETAHGLVVQTMALELGPGTCVTCVAFTGDGNVVAVGLDAAAGGCTSSSPTKKRGFFGKEKQGVVRIYRAFLDREGSLSKRKAAVTSGAGAGADGPAAESHLGGHVHFVRDLLFHKGLCSLSWICAARAHKRRARTQTQSHARTPNRAGPAHAPRPRRSDKSPGPGAQIFPGNRDARQCSVQTVLTALRLLLCMKRHRMRRGMGPQQPRRHHRVVFPRRCGCA